jgi:hypothetical protein
MISVRALGTAGIRERMVDAAAGERELARQAGDGLVHERESELALEHVEGLVEVVVVQRRPLPGVRLGLAPPAHQDPEGRPDSAVCVPYLRVQVIS